jgi:creatinine amidohydrolase
MAMYIAERAAEEAGVLLLPPIWYGYTYVLDKFLGTISISQETLYRLYKDVFLEAARNGVKYLAVVNGHGGNVDLLSRSGGRQDESRRRVDKLVGG